MAGVAEHPPHRFAEAVGDVGAEDGDRGERGDQHDGAVQVGAFRDLPFFARVLAAFGSRFLGLVGFIGHRSPHPDPGQAGFDRALELVENQPDMKGSAAATTSRPTIIFIGKPTAKMFSCGTTRETTPKATSVRISASSTGAGDLERGG